MNKLTTLIFAISFCLVPNVFAQTTNSLSATCNATDNNGFNYVAGVFEGVVHFGRHTLISKGSDDIFIAKFSAKGDCIWATRAGGANSDYVSSMAIDKNQNIYLTGRFGNNAEFDDRKFTTTATNEFFVANYNASGDLMHFVRSHSKKDSDNMGTRVYVTPKNQCIVTVSLSETSQIEGKDYSKNATLKLNSSLEVIRSFDINAKTTDIKVDKAGSTYFLGDYSGKLTLAENSITSLGANDLFITKYNASGKNLWLQSIGGDKNETAKRLALDNTGNIIISGLFRGVVSVDSKTIESKGEADMVVAKLNGTGNLLWLKGGGGNGFDNVNDIVVNNNKISVIGEIDGDLADFDKLSIGGLSQNVFVVNYSPSGQVVSGVFGESNNPCEGISLTTSNGQTNCIGNFEEAINFGKQSLAGQKDGKSIFMASLNEKNVCVSITKLGETSADFEYDPNAVYTDVKGKLMVGKEEKKPLINQVVSLFEKSGSFIQSTITDVFGDFSFKNIDSKQDYNLDFGENDSIPDGEPIYLAKQTGEIVSPIFRDSNGKFKFELLEPVVQTLALINEEDPIDDLKAFMKNSAETEKTIVENIYYETNSHSLLPEYKKELYNIIKAVRSNQSLTLEILSYTDARGDENYNLELSEKRAKEVRDYLVKRGMKEDNITFKGLGESKILNRCVDGVTNCSEKEHSLNRRTEFKFVKN